MKAGYLVDRFGKWYFGLVDTTIITPNLSTFERLANVKRIFETRMGIYFLDMTKGKNRS